MWHAREKWLALPTYVRLYIPPPLRQHHHTHHHHHTPYIGTLIHTTTTEATPPYIHHHTPTYSTDRTEKQGRPTDREKSGRITKVILKYGGQTSIHPRIEPTKSGTRKVAKPSKVILKYGGQTSIHPRIATEKSGPRQHHHTPPVTSKVLLKYGATYIHTSKN